MDEDLRFMRRALELARRGTGRVHPNPLVGAVLVRDGRVVGEGWHARFGEPHAEVHALRNAGALARGATLYATLEPCAHHGKTPPCVDAILGAGVRRVVAATFDPNPQVNGEGFERLRAAGVEVVIGPEGRAARALNAPFLQLHREARSLVTLKLAASLDGRIAGAGGEARWITSAPSRREVHALRAEVDAVLIGRRTAERDDPSLTVRDAEGRNPVRIVVDSRGALPRSLALFSDGAARTVHATLQGMPAAAGEHWELAADAEGRVSLAALFRRAAQEGLLHVLVEGGATLATSLVRERLVDVLRLYTAPTILGTGGSLSWALDLGPARIGSAPKLRIVDAHVVGDDVATVAIAPSHPAYADLDPVELPVAAG
jgi:diaminohydroxyphosphoribosylaminopyrimidine deaminase/5-amino-6-(5-phosphoribosylamino)uracil reductase